MALGSNQSRIGYHGSDTGTGSRIGQVTFSPRRISMFDTEGIVLNLDRSLDVVEWLPSSVYQFSSYLQVQVDRYWFIGV